MASAKRALGKISTLRVFSSSSASKHESPLASKERWARRCRLLDASRGLLTELESGDNSKFHNGKKRALPVFPLEARHFGSYDGGTSSKALAPNSPKEFHRALCEMIRGAKYRVRIASLYVGPATSNQDDCEEAEFLRALSDTVNRNHKEGGRKVSVKIILDENRALRPVPTNHSSDSDNKDLKTITSSAEAVARAIHGEATSSLHLFRVLPDTTVANEKWLPNPLDEIGGVFHIKIYIVDDQLLLSGANLSREYFKDRMDRYLHLIDGGNGLVDFYAELVEILCRHSNEYRSSDSKGHLIYGKKNGIADFRREITNHFQDSSFVPSSEELMPATTSTSSSPDDAKIVAFGIPTFQAPRGFFGYKDISTGERKVTPVSIAKDIARAWTTFWYLFRIDQQVHDTVDFITDVDATLNLFQEAGTMNNTDPTERESMYSVHLSSAYLNPTEIFVDSMRNNFGRIQLLTAGKISHGFKPKQKDCKEGSQGTDWTIPSVFDRLVDDCMLALRSASKSGDRKERSPEPDSHLFYWERPDWTFHAKGIWMKEYNSKEKNDVGEVAATILGSSNFGFRSFCRDMESNLILVFPPTTGSTKDKCGISQSFGHEWKDLLASSKAEPLDHKRDKSTRGAKKAPPLPWPILKSIPYIKSFF